ncbi:multicatalytic endopeptidase [Orobanche minor]
MAGMERLHRMFACAGRALSHPLRDSLMLDSSEQVYVSSLALLKMLKHGGAGVPMEVMGLILVDVFAMPQIGTGVSVEAVDHVFQTNMLDMLKQTGIPEMVVDWYHSHPGFGCWLSGYDINTQNFEALNQRAVAVVVDPIQSVKREVVIDAFRLINPQILMLGQEPRQTTSNVGHLNRPSIQAFHSISINYRKNELEKMLLNLHKNKWTDGLTLQRFDTHSETKQADSAGGNHYWGRKDSGKVEGIVVVFAWMSSQEKHLKNYVDIYSFLGWNSIVCQSQFLNLFFPEKAASLAREVVNEPIQELKIRPCPIIHASFSGGPKACMYKVIQIIEGKCEEQINLKVTGLMLGEFVDEYTLRVMDVFAMQLSGTGVSVEAVDHVFQTNMLDMLKQTGM